MWREKLREPLIAGIATIIAGLVFIIFTEGVLAWTLRIIGALLLIVEVVRLVELWKLSRVGAHVMAAVLSEAMVALLALVLVVAPVGALHALSIGIGIYMAVSAAMSLYRASQYRGKRRAGFWVSTAMAILMAIAGIWLVVYPASLYGAAGIFIGVALIVKGISIIIDGALDKGDKEKNEKSSDYYSDDDFVDKSHEL